MSMPGLLFREQLRASDPGRIEALVRATGFFSQEEIAIARELADDALVHGENSHYRFILTDGGDVLAGYACFGRIPATRSGWDLYWIVVGPAFQAQGLGGRILKMAELRVASAGGERLYAETSSREQYAPTRQFYVRYKFTQTADFPDFYAPGDGKIVYVKLLDNR
jgi:GNAT superfamily N-acetyltransferase